MRRASYPIPACALTLALATTSGAGAAELAGGEWRPVEIGSVQIPADAGMFVRFAGGGKLEGHGGCNRFFGSYELAEDRIAIGPLGATRMACQQPIMEHEMRFLQALGNARRFARGRIDLVFTDEEGAPVAKLIQRDAD
ncbi:MAG: META domain-containing protein [Alphaproteobacteria bacterium]